MTWVQVELIGIQGSTSCKGENMPFVQEKATKPSSIGNITLRVYGPAPGSDESRFVVATVQVVLDDGSSRMRQVDLTDILTATQITQLNNLVDSIRTKATTAMIPVP